MLESGLKYKFLNNDQVLTLRINVIKIRKCEWMLGKQRHTSHQIQNIHMHREFKCLWYDTTIAIAGECKHWSDEAFEGGICKDVW